MEVTVSGHPGGAACAEPRVCETRLQVAFPARSCPVSGVRAASVVASCEERPGGPERTALPLALPSSSSKLQSVKSHRNLQRPPGSAKTGPQSFAPSSPSSPSSPFPPGAPEHKEPGKDWRGGGGRSRRRHGEVPEGRPGRCRSCVTLPLFNGPVSVH